MIRPANSDDLEPIAALLTEAGLPIRGVAENLDSFVVSTADGELIGVGGFESHGSDVLLRSLAVAPAHRGRGVATAICNRLEVKAAKQGARSIYILTETAERFFAARGYVLVLRSEAPPAIAASEEFAVLCGASATLMRRHVVTDG